MIDERNERAKSFFRKIANLPHSVQEEYLDKLEKDDPEIVAATRLLVEENHRFTKPPAAATEDGPVSEEFGPYRLLRRLGQGGMGEVYLAEQLSPIRRTVAIKLIKLGMDTREIISRFESEKQAMALMDHPSIAHVFDAGISPEGRPFFAMEYVPGIPITEFADRYQLHTKERLRLFIEVCNGIQHAHQRGVIHRDIKPANVLVLHTDGKPSPKVIDFGISKATSQHPGEQKILTEQGQIIGTPEYMSPEQAGLTPLGISTTTDVYSLGVLLYELLSGVLPYDSEDLRKGGWEITLRTIREVDPPRPSTRLEGLGDRAQTIAEKRKTPLSVLRRELRGELDWVVLKAMAKNPARRYASASELAADVSRYLDNEPIVARPPSSIYFLRKIATRHKVAALFVVTVFTLVTAFGLLMSVLYNRAESQRGRAEKAEDIATKRVESYQELSDFLIGMFGVSDPEEARGRTVTANEILEEGAKRVRGELSGQPEEKARVLNTLGRVYSNLGRYEEARPLLEEALEIRRVHSTDNQLDLIESLRRLAEVFLRMGEGEEARGLFRESLEIAETRLGADDLQTATALEAMAEFHREAGEYEEARPLYERALSIREQHSDSDDEQFASALGNLANLLYISGDYAQARELFERCLEIREKHLAPDHPTIALSLNNLANAVLATRDSLEAGPLLERALRIQKKVLGPDHEELAGGQMNLGFFLHQTGDYDQAKSYYEQAIDTYRRALGEEHPEVALAINNLGSLYDDMGHFDEARALYEQAVAMWEATLGRGHPYCAVGIHNLANTRRKSGHFIEAEPLYREVQRTWESAFGPTHEYVAKNLEQLAVLLRETGRIEEAKVLEEKVRRIRTDQTP